MSVTTAPVTRSTLLPAGIGVAMVSAASFGSSGVFAKSLTEAGWTPGGALLVRIALAALILTIPGIVSMRGRWQELFGPGQQRTQLTVLMYGIFSVAGCQLAFFQGIQHVSVGVALLLEYLGPLMLMAWAWGVTRVRPSNTTLVGAAIAIAGLFVVLDVARGATLSLPGIGWGLLAAACVATYFHISGSTGLRLPPVALVWLGLMLGAATLALAGLVGILSIGGSARDVVLRGASLPFWVSAVGVALISTALAYSSGVVATRRLGATVASFVGLAEVLFTVVFAWLLLGQHFGLPQVIGAAVMLTGVVLVQNGTTPREPAGPVPA